MPASSELESRSDEFQAIEFQAIDELVDRAAASAQVHDAPPPASARVDIADRKEFARAVGRWFRRHPQRIPPIIHQIWIGPNTPPWEWIDTFRRDFVAAFPHWEHRLWTEREVKALSLANQSLYDAEPEFCGKADILRYELLDRFGGIYIDADARWLNDAPLDDLRMLTGESGLFAGRENAHTLANGVIGCSAGNPLMRLLVRTLPFSYEVIRRQKNLAPWIATGPRFLTEVLAGLPVTVFPPRYFYPVSWHGVSSNVDVSGFRDSYMIHYGYSTNGLDGA